MISLLLLFSFHLGVNCVKYESQKWLPVQALLASSEYTSLFAVTKVNAAKNCEKTADCETFCLLDAGYVMTKVGLQPEYCEAETGTWMECWTKIPSKPYKIGSAGKPYKIGSAGKPYKIGNRPSLDIYS